MKKSLVFVLGAVLMLSSCSTLYRSSTISRPVNSVVTSTFAELEVSPEKISYTLLRPRKEIRAAGIDNCVATAVYEALQEHGGDVLVGMEYSVNVNARKVVYVTVTGYPATYKNFRSLAPEDLKGSGNYYPLIQNTSERPVFKASRRFGFR